MLGALAVIVRLMRTQIEGLRERIKELVVDLKEHDDESAKYRENQARK